MKFFGFLVTAVLAVGSAQAGDFKRDGSRVACTPFANGDGTQVLATFATSYEKCGAWSTTNLVRLADLTERVLCNYIGEECVREEDLSKEGREYLAELEHYMKPLAFEHCPPITDWKTFLVETVPAGNGHGCSLSNAAVRSYDLLTGTVTFLDGKGKKVGRMELSPERFKAVLAGARSE